MKLIVTPTLEENLSHYPDVWHNIQNWNEEVGYFLDLIGITGQAELTGQIVEDLLVGRMNLFISPTLHRSARMDKGDLIYQIQYFEEQLELPTLDFIYGYGQV